MLVSNSSFILLRSELYFFVNSVSLSLAIAEAAANSAISLSLAIAEALFDSAIIASFLSFISV